MWLAGAPSVRGTCQPGAAGPPCTRAPAPAAPFSAGAVVCMCSRRRSSASTLALHSPWGWICEARQRGEVALETTCRRAEPGKAWGLSPTVGPAPRPAPPRPPGSPAHPAQRLELGVASVGGACPPRCHAEHLQGGGGVARRVGRLGDCQRRQPWAPLGGTCAHLAGDHLVAAHRAHALQEDELCRAVLAEGVAARAAVREDVGGRGLPRRVTTPAACC